MRWAEVAALAVLTAAVGVLGYIAWDQHDTIGELRDIARDHEQNLERADGWITDVDQRLGDIEFSVDELDRELGGDGFGLLGDGLSDRVDQLEREIATLGTCVDSVVRALTFDFTFVYC